MYTGGRVRKYIASKWQRKVYDKDEVGYEHPAKGPDHCSQCVHFRTVGTCEIVRGRIAPEDWCRKWEGTMPAKSKAQQAAMAIAEHAPEKLHKENRGLLSMSKGQLHDFASTKRKGLPQYAPDAKGKAKAERKRFTL